MKFKFYHCPVCGNIVIKLVDSGVTPLCCGSPMRELVANSLVEVTASEKHIPVVQRVDQCTLRVEVGSEPHPMKPEHHICFVFLETKHGGQFCQLDPNGAAVAVFNGCQDSPIAVYEYCNIHGLWVTDKIPEMNSRICCPM